jgi:tetratricopeptide (TPR) repeat protein
MQQKQDVKRLSITGAACLGGLALALAACTAPTHGADVQPTDAAAPQSVLGAYLAARHAQQDHDFGNASRYMDHVLADDPDNSDLVRRTFVLRVSEGRIDEALPLAKRIVDLDHTAGLAQMVLMLRDVRAGDYNAAMGRVKAMTGDGAQRLAVPLLTAWCDMGLGQPEPAFKALGEMGDLRGVQTLQDLHHAMLADLADRLDDAEAAYKKVTAEPARLTWRTVELAGNFYERHQRSEEARRLYQRLAAGEQGGEVVEQALARIDKGEVPARIIASARDGIAESLFDLASVLDQRETQDASLIYARMALDLRPGFPLAQMLVAEIDESEHRVPEALDIYNSIDRQSPLAWTARLRAASALDQLDRTDEAIAELKRMAEERPKEPAPLVEEGDILRGRNRFAEAAAAYDAAIARVDTSEKRQWRLFYSRGVALERAGQWPRAEADLQRALALQPEQPLVLNYLGYSWIDRGVHLDEALKMIQRAVDLRPNDGYIVDSLGWAYYRLSDVGNATKLLERAIELLPEDPTINDHLGDAYWQAGRLAEARFQWRRALQFKPDADQVKVIETKLDRGIAKLPAAASARGG